jgi:hypothetical protein
VLGLWEMGLAMVKRLNYLKKLLCIFFQNAIIFSGKNFDLKGKIANKI